MCNYVESVFIGFVEHVSVDQNREAEISVYAIIVSSQHNYNTENRTYGPRLMCFTFTLILPIAEISESG